jgi:hypothetical protein
MGAVVTAKLDRFASAIDKPVPTVKRWSKQTPAIPLKSMLLLAFLPDLSRSVSLQDDHHLFVHMLFWVKRTARGNLADIHPR